MYKRTAHKRKNKAFKDSRQWPCVQFKQPTTPQPKQFNERKTATKLESRTAS